MILARIAHVIVVLVFGRTACPVCGEHHRNQARHLWFDHGDIPTD